MPTTDDKSLRRKFLQMGLSGAMIGLAGCTDRINIRTPEDNETSRSSENEESSSSSGDDDTSQTFTIELVPTWEQEAMFNLATADGDFFSGHSRVTRISSSGQQLFETAEFASGYRAIIDSGWRNSLYADSSGVYLGLSPDDEAKGAQLAAFEPASGERRWTHEEPADGLHNNIRATTRTDDLIIYASMSSGSGSDQEPIVRAVDSQSGTEQWNIAFSEGFIPGLFISDGRLFVQETFRLRVYELGTQDHITEVDIDAGFNRARSDGDKLFVPGETIQALSLPSGNEQWSVETGREVNTSPAVGGEGMFVGTEAGYILGYDLDTGEKLWERRVEGVVDHPPIFANGVLWVASERGGLSAFDEATGELLYREEVEPNFEFAIQDNILRDTERDTAFEIQGA